MLMFPNVCVSVHGRSHCTAAARPMKALADEPMFVFLASAAALPGTLEHDMLTTEPVFASRLA